MNLGGKCSVPVEQGDMFRLQTPGGGGYGPVQVNFIIISRYTTRIIIYIQGQWPKDRQTVESVVQQYISKLNLQRL